MRSVPEIFDVSLVNVPLLQIDKSLSGALACWRTSEVCHKAPVNPAIRRVPSGGFDVDSHSTKSTHPQQQRTRRFHSLLAQSEREAKCLVLGLYKGLSVPFEKRREFPPIT